MNAQFRQQFDAASTPQGAAFSLGLGQLYNVTQPTYAIGELIYSDTTTTLASLAPNTSASKMFLSMTGTGSAGASPVWETIEAADITDFSEAVDDRVDALIQDASAGLTWTYNDGANTLTPVFANDLGALEALSGTNTIYYRSASDTWTAVTIHASLTFSGGTLSTTIAAAPDDAQYLTLATNSTLSAERVLTPGTGLTGSDGGAGSTYTLNVGAGTGITVNADDVALTVPVTVSLGGSGATTLTGLLQGNGTSAFTTITNSTTVGQVLRVTGSNTYGFGALDLADGDAITGVIPNANVNFASPAAIGSSTPAAGTFTTLTANGNTTLGDASGDSVTINAKTITAPNAPCVSAYNSANDNDVTGDGTTVTVDFDTEITDQGGDFASDTYTAAITSPHAMAAAVRIIQLTAGTSTTTASLVTSNRTYSPYLNDVPTATTKTYMIAHEAVDMDSGDTATIQATVSNTGGKTTDIFGSATASTYFSIRAAH